MYNPRIRANSEVLRPISQCQADLRKQLSGPTGMSACWSQSDSDVVKNTFNLYYSNVGETSHSQTSNELTGFIYFLGKCFCLYLEDNQLPAKISPQILECNITPTVLFLKRIEIAGLGQCEFIDRPG